MELYVSTYTRRDHAIQDKIQELEESIRNIIDSVNFLSDEFTQTLRDYNVTLRDENGEYRSTYDIMSDIAKQWNNMTSMEQDMLSNTGQQYMEENEVLNDFLNKFIRKE